MKKRKLSTLYLDRETLYRFVVAAADPKPGTVIETDPGSDDGVCCQGLSR